MPVLNALGVAASISVSDLEASLDSTIRLTMGSEQQKETKRIESVFDHGRDLPEEPLGPTASDSTVMQTLGEFGDKPLFMVVVGDNLPTESHSQPLSEHSNQVDEEPLRSPSTIAESPYTEPSNSSPHSDPILPPSERNASAAPSTPATSFSTEPGNTPRFLSFLAPKPPKQSPTSQSNLRPSFDASTPDLSRSPSFYHSRNTVSTVRQQLALAVKIDYTAKTFLRKKRGTGTGKDLKFEVFLNGQLVDTVFVPKHRSGAFLTKSNDTQRFSGTRFHRQTERPWIYQQDASYAQQISSADAKRRWETIGAALAVEADIRGGNSTSQRTISGDFLQSLSKVSFPKRLGTKGRKYGVFDVVITAGQGMKDGSEYFYIMKPTRLRNPGLNSVEASSAKHDNNADEELQPQEACYESPHPSPTPRTHPHYSKPSLEREILPSNDLAPLDIAPFKTPATPTDRKRFLDTRLSTIPSHKLKSKIGYLNTHGKQKSGRSVKQRLADIAKMSPKKREEAWQALSLSLDPETVRAITGSESYATAADSRTLPVQAIVVEATRMPPRYPVPESLEGQYLTQTINPKLLLRDRDVSPSPIQPTWREEPRTPRRRSNCAAVTPVRPGSNRTARQWDPNEPSIKEASTKFEVPALCNGSSVTYAGVGVQRQVAKARGGEFKEEDFIVGMRFVVM